MKLCRCQGIEGENRQDRQCTCNVTLRLFRVTIAAAQKKKQVLHILSVCVALDIQHAECMRHTVICGLPGSTTSFHII